jgi:hypothetical protein
MRRVAKYMRQGFTMCAGGMADFLEKVGANPEVIRRDVGYVD